MRELMSLEEIDKSWSDYLDELDPGWVEMSRLCETARAAHTLTAENEVLREQLRTARSEERERAVKILKNLNTIIGHPCMIAEVIEEVMALGDAE